MPKTKSIKKKSGTSTRAGNNLKKSTQSQRLVVFILVFALVGGFFVLKSFAASTTTTVYPDKFIYTNGSKLGTDSIGKSPVQVGILTRITTNPTSPPWIRANFPVNYTKATTISVCVTARGQVSNNYPRSPSFEVAGGDSIGPAGAYWVVPQTTTYKDYCTNTTVAPGAHTLEFSWDKVYVTASGNDTTSSEIYISKAFIK